jgi:hypothetical protein
VENGNLAGKEGAAMPSKQMSRSIALAALVIVATLMLGEAITTAQALGLIAADAPTLVPGDTWTIRYSNGVRGMRKFLREDAGILIFEVAHTSQDGNSAQGLLHLTRDLSIVRMLGVDGTEQRRFDPHSAGLQFPLAVGKEWEERCQRFDEGGLVGTFTGTYKVVGVEEAGAPAGRFQTFRVEGQTYELRDPTRRWRFTHWYAPAVRMEVRFRAVEPDGSSVQYELVEFRPAGTPRPSASFQGLGAFLGIWEGHWRETLLATKLTVENIEGDTASVIYWRGASPYPVFQRPSQQRGEGRFLDEKTLRLAVWDVAGNRWADVTYTLNSDGTLTGQWSSGGYVQHATLQKQT